MGVSLEYEGKTYDDLGGNLQRKLDDSVLRSIVVEQVEPKDNQSIYHLFQRLNSGGTTLTSQEIRNCIYAGNFNELLITLNTYTTWRKLYKKDKPDDRMRDVALILRFFALYYNIENYEKPLNEFLNNFMDKYRTISQQQITEMDNLFKTTIDFIYNKLTPEAIRPRGNINMAVFDSLVYSVAKYKTELKPNLSYDIIKQMFADHNYVKVVTEGTTDLNVVKLRMDIAKKYLVG